jgi:glucose/mannose transport system substrate-binding protein
MRMRRYPIGRIVLGALLLVGGVGACGSNQSGSTTKGNDKVEVFTWLAGPGEEEALNGLIDHFNQDYPGIQFINASIAGGAGANARAVLSWRLEANNPPDSYQAHPGMELAADVEAGRLAELNGLYDRQGWWQKFPKGLIDASSIKGKVYSVPIDIHRTNLLWYNPSVLARAGITNPPSTWTEFLTQTATFKAAGITPIAVGPDWTQKQLLETILLGELGVDTYLGLWTGSTDWRDPKVGNALNIAGRVFANSDVRSPSSDWQSMVDKTLNPNSGAAQGAAYTVSGDWAYAQALRRGLKYKTDFTVMATPGTDGVYDFTSDAFTMPKEAPHPGAAEKWLYECGSVEAQNVFNPLKGSIPARTDIDVTKYTGYFQEALAKWRDPNTKIIGSLAHGVLVNGRITAAVDAAVAKFVSDRDPDKFIETITQAIK